MQLDEAKALAERMVALFEPSCERIVIAGSIRRGKAEVKDIEIVALPRVISHTAPVDLFGSLEEQVTDLLDERIAEQLNLGTLKLDTVVKRNGPSYKRFMLEEGIACELFIAKPDNFGNILTIRTGNADFSRLLVTPRRSGGCMPGGMHQRDGYLWRELRSGDEKIACPTEESFFKALGIEWVEPKLRTAEVVAGLLKRAVRS